MCYRQTMLRSLASTMILWSVYATAETFEQYQKLYGVAMHHELKDLHRNPGNTALATKIRDVVTKLRAAKSEEVRGDQNRQRLLKHADDLEAALDRIVPPTIPAPAQQPAPAEPIAPQRGFVERGIAREPEARIRTGLPAPEQAPRQGIIERGVAREPGSRMRSAQPAPQEAPRQGIIERGIAREPGTRQRQMPAAPALAAPAEEPRKKETPQPVIEIERKTAAIPAGERITRAPMPAQPAERMQPRVTPEVEAEVAREIPAAPARPAPSRPVRVEAGQVQPQPPAQRLIARPQRPAEEAEMVPVEAPRVAIAGVQIPAPQRPAPSRPVPVEQIRAQPRPPARAGVVRPAAAGEREVAARRVAPIPQAEIARVRPAAPARPAPIHPAKRERAMFENLRTRFFDAVANDDEETMNDVYAEADKTIATLATIPESEREALLDAMDFGIRQAKASKRVPLKKLQASIEQRRAQWDEFETLSNQFFAARDAQDLASMQATAAAAEKMFTELPVVPIEDRTSRIEEMKKEIETIQEEKEEISPVSQAPSVRTMPGSLPAPLTPITPTSPATLPLSPQQMPSETPEQAAAKMAIERSGGLYNQLSNINDSSYDIYGWAEKNQIPSDKILDDWEEEREKAKKLGEELTSLSNSTSDAEAKKYTENRAMFSAGLIEAIEKNSASFLDFLKAKKEASQLIIKAKESKDIAPTQQSIHEWQVRLAVIKKQSEPIVAMMNEIVKSSEKSKKKLIKRANDVIKALAKTVATVDHNIIRAKANQAINDLEQSAKNAQAIQQWDKDTIDRWHKRLDDTVNVVEDIKKLVQGIPKGDELLNRALAAAEAIDRAIPGAKPNVQLRAKTMPATALGLGLGGKPTHSAAEEKEEAAGTMQMAPQPINPSGDGLGLLPKPQAAPALLTDQQLIVELIPLIRLEAAGKLEGEKFRRFSSLKEAFKKRFPGYDAEDINELIKLGQDKLKEIEKLNKDAVFVGFRDWRTREHKTPEETVAMWEKELIPKAEKNAALLPALEGIQELSQAAFRAQGLLAGIRAVFAPYKLLANGEAEHKQLKEDLDKAILGTQSKPLIALKTEIEQKKELYKQNAHLIKIFDELLNRASQFAQFFAMRELFDAAVANKDIATMQGLLERAEDEFPDFNFIPDVQRDGLIQDMNDSLKKLAPEAGKRVRPLIAPRVRRAQ